MLDPDTGERVECHLYSYIRKHLNGSLLVGLHVTAVNSVSFHVLFDLTNYGQHTVRVQYRNRNPFKQASVLVCNHETCYISVMIL